MILSFALEFEERDAMEETAEKLWNKHGVTGEMEKTPLDEGRWRLTIHSEKQLRDNTIESLKGTRVKAGTVLGK